MLLVPSLSRWFSSLRVALSILPSSFAVSVSKSILPSSVSLAVSKSILPLSVPSSVSILPSSVTVSKPDPSTRSPWCYCQASAPFRRGCGAGTSCPNPLVEQVVYMWYAFIQLQFVGGR